MRLETFVISVVRFSECLAFYRDLLGCELVDGDERGPVAYLRSGNQRFALLDRSRQPAGLPGGDREPGPPRVTLAFASEDIEREFERLKAAGVPYAIEPRDFPDWGVRSSVCLDPDGNPVEIVEAARS